MRHVFIITGFILFIISSAFAQKGSLDSFFEKYQGNEQFTMVNISPKMFSVIAGTDMESIDPELKEILDNIHGMKILTRNTEGNQYLTEALNVINKNKLEELMTVKREKDNVKIYGKGDGNQYLSEVVMVTDGEKGFAIMQILGQLRLDQISKLSKTLNK